MSHRRMSGFTLLELLVVIAIIAILAAILFPVFAQARAKARQATCLSNTKQEANAIHMYVQDNDEQFPQGQILWTPGWSLHTFFTTPPDLRAGNVHFRSLLWTNSTQPYTKNYQLYDCPSEFTWNISTNNPPGTPRIARSFNGLLSTYTLAGVASPASLYMVWSGFQGSAPNGLTNVNPQMDCPDATAPCVYKARGPAGCAGGNGSTSVPWVYGGQPSYSVWVHGTGDNHTFVDGHAKWVPLKGDWRTDAYVYTRDNGEVVQGGFFSYWYDGCHAWLFRPDYVP